MTKCKVDVNVKMFALTVTLSFEISVRLTFSLSINVYITFGVGLDGDTAVLRLD